MKNNDLNKQINILFKRSLFFESTSKNSYYSFIFIFKNNSIDLSKITRNSLLNIYFFDEFYSNKQKKIFKLIKKFQNIFEIIYSNRNEVLILFENRLYKIYFKKKIPKKIESIKKFNVMLNKIQFMYSPNFISNYFINYISSIFYKNKIFSLSFKEFLNLDMTNMGVSKIVRDNNMNLITNNGRYVKIKDILNNFKEIDKNKIFSKIYFNKKLFFKSLSSKIPLYCNTNYWKSTNFFLINNIINGFHQKNFNYENQSVKNNFYKLYKQKKITKSSYTKINELLYSPDLTIINIRPYASRNRLLAMIGYILQGGKYINFSYRKYFDQDINKQKLINLFSDYFSIFQFKDVKIYNLDSNYFKLFNDRGININFKHMRINESKKMCFFFNGKKNYKEFKFIEVDKIINLPSAIISLINSVSGKKSCFYLDFNNKSNIFEKKNFLTHFLKIFLTVVIFKPKILIVIE